LPLHTVEKKSKAAEILSQRRAIWARKPIIRRLYGKWYGLIKSALKPGRTLELGGGSGNLREFLPEAITSDIVFAPWLDALLDAHALPFGSETLDSIILFDVLHHLKSPVLFFQEVDRVLKRKGRCVMMEPYVSWSSFLVYRFLHAEGLNWHADPFKIPENQSQKDPLRGNQAIPTLIFEKHKKRFVSCFPRLKVVLEERMDSILYPLSGGFHNPSICPPSLWKPLGFIEELLRPLNRCLAFRLFVVLEKK
jgi:SAM-dependent methyltransferase